MFALDDFGVYALDRAQGRKGAAGLTVEDSVHRRLRNAADALRKCGLAVFRDPLDLQEHFCGRAVFHGALEEWFASPYSIRKWMVCNTQMNATLTRVIRARIVRGMNTNSEQGFGDRLDELMQDDARFGARGQSALASASGVPQPTISRILKKNGAPEMETVVKLAVVFGVTCEWMLTGRGPKYARELGADVVVYPDENLTAQTIPAEMATLIKRLRNLHTEVQAILSYAEGLPSVSAEEKHSEDRSIPSVRAKGAAAAKLIREGGRHEDQRHGKRRNKPLQGGKP